jgi:hypothetical protein
MDFQYELSALEVILVPAQLVRPVQSCTAGAPSVYLIAWIQDGGLFVELHPSWPVGQTVTVPGIGLSNGVTLQPCSMSANGGEDTSKSLSRSLPSPYHAKAYTSPAPPALRP